MNSPLNQKLRSIRINHRAEAVLQSAFASYGRFEDIWVQGDSWVLAHGPERGVQLPNGHWMMKFHSYVRFTSVPGRTLLYTFDDEFIDLISVKITP